MTIARVALTSLIVLGAGPSLFAELRENPGSEATATAQSQGAGSGQGQSAGTLNANADATNIRLDVTISDQSVDGPPVKKSISLILANRGSGRVRSTGTLTQEWVTPGMTRPDGTPVINIRPVGEVQLNLDAEVMIVGDNKVRTMLTLEYTPGGQTPLPNESVITRSPLNQSVTVNLTSGQPLIITQAADPLSERKVTVEVTATIVR